MLLGEAELRVSVRVVEGTDRGEDLVVVGQRRTGGLLGREVDRAIRLEDGHELAPVDSALRVDLVDEDLVRLLLVGLDGVDELLDTREVDHHDPDLDLLRADARAERGVLRRRRGRRHGRRRGLRTAAVLGAAAARGCDGEQRDGGRAGPPSRAHRVSLRPVAPTWRGSRTASATSSCRAAGASSQKIATGTCRRSRTCPSSATRRDRRRGSRSDRRCSRWLPSWRR
jgi:hypothetical protein